MYKFRLYYKYMYVMYGKKLVYILLYLKSAIERNVALYKNINFIKYNVLNQTCEILLEIVLYIHIYIFDTFVV